MGLTCGLGARSLLHDSKKIWLALRTTAATLELGSLFDRERHVMYVAVNLRCGLQRDGLATNDPRDRTADDHLLARDHAGHFTLLTDYDFGGQYVTLDLTPWPMILRSVPITDFSPVEGALIDDSALLAQLGRAVRSGFGSADELRVNMKSPK